MLTFFTIPKPFVKPYATIQKKAIKSWETACTNCQILILGNEEGTEQICQEFQTPYIPNIRHNQHGTPFLDSVFEIAREFARFDIFCYCNADIILLADFSKILKAVPFDKFLLIGQRIDYDKPVNLNSLDIEKDGKLHGITGIDYFVFTKNVFREIPPFLVGRWTWDNWLVYEAIQEKAFVVDATSVIKAIHQDHPKTQVREDEHKHNLSFATWQAWHTYISDAQYEFRGMEVVKK